MADPRLDAAGELPSDDHVVRYCGFAQIRKDGTPAPGAFLPDADGYVSVFWLEFGEVEGEHAQWNDMRARMRASNIKFGAQAKLAKLAVGPTKAEVLRQLGRRIAIRHMPVLNDGKP